MADRAFRRHSAVGDQGENQSISQIPGKMRTGILRSWKTLLVVCVANLLVRAAFYPLYQTVEGDAILRIIDARGWLDQPRVITWGVWGPLHFYLLGGALALVPDQVIAPILLNVLFATATAIVL
jgi:hypothetical protein